jgi:hypothetical protein
MEDFIDSLDQIIYIVSLNQRYMVYNASRRRLVRPTVQMAAGFTPLDLITTENLSAWTRTSRYRVNPDEALAPRTITYREAVVESHDRFDIHQMMRSLLTPRSIEDRDRTTRNELSHRIDRVIEGYARNHDASSGYSDHQPCAQFKGGFYYENSTMQFILARTTYRDFGRLVARAKAGDESITNDELRSRFFELANRYSDASSPIANAFSVIDAMGDMDITYCDCGHYEHSDNTHDVRRDTWCDSCFDDDAVLCEDNDEYYPRDDAYYSERDNCYYSYDRDEDDDDDDNDDYDRDNDRNQPIMSYSTNVLHVLDYPSGITSSHFGEFTMGIELEMTSGDHDSNEAAELVRSRLGTDYCIIKSDGSLPHNGFEVVTSPQGLAKHIEKFKAWEIDPAYRAWNTGKCGTHVHIDSRGFTQLTLGKFLMFINSAGNVDFIRKIAGRHPSVDDQARSYCAAEHQSILANPKTAVKGKSGERYRMVNMCNLGSREAKRLGLSMDNSYNGKYNTVELRIFKASLKKERLLAQIEFTHASVMFCRVASWRDLNGTSFVKWLKTVAGQYPALTKWYGVRVVHGASKQPSAPAEATCTDAVTPTPSVASRYAQGHDHLYLSEIAYEDGNGMRAYANRHGLFFTFFRVIGVELAVFPYGGDETHISDVDVIYVRDNDVWRLQEDSFNELIMGHDPVSANSVSE